MNINTKKISDIAGGIFIVLTVLIGIVSYVSCTIVVIDIAFKSDFAERLLLLSLVIWFAAFIIWALLDDLKKDK